MSSIQSKAWTFVFFAGLVQLTPSASMAEDIDCSPDRIDQPFMVGGKTCLCVPGWRGNSCLYYGDDVCDIFEERRCVSSNSDGTFDCVLDLGSYVISDTSACNFCGPVPVLDLVCIGGGDDDDDDDDDDNGDSDGDGGGDDDPPPPPAPSPQSCENCCTDAGPNSIDVASGAATYPAHRPDATLGLATGNLDFSRKYSSIKAKLDLTGIAGQDALLPRSYGNGWFNPYESMIHVDVSHQRPEEQVRFITPDGVTVHGSGGSLNANTPLSFPTLEGGVTIQPEGSQRLVYIDKNGTRWLYEMTNRIGRTTFSTSFPARNHIYVVIEVQPADGIKRRVRRYFFSSTPNGNSCAVMPGTELERPGRICIIQASTEGYIKFINYEDTFVDLDGNTVTEGRPIEVIYGPGSDPGLYTGRTTYEYESVEVRNYSPVEDCGSLAGRVESFGEWFQCQSLQQGPRTRRLLKKVRYYRSEAGGVNEVEFDSESYTYTDQSYYRPDLDGDSPGANPYSESKQIITLTSPQKKPNGFQNLYLLETVRNADNNFVERYGYTDRGHAASLISAQEALRLEYYGEDESSIRTVLTDEMTQKTKEFRIDRKTSRLLESSSECGCGDVATSFEIDEKGLVLGMSEPAPDDIQSGTRTAFSRDPQGRTLWEIRNYNFLVPDDPAATINPVSEHVDMRRFEYGRHPSRPTVVDRVNSVACEEAPFWDSICVDANDSPRTITDFDTDRLGEPNEEAATIPPIEAPLQPSRTIEEGFTTAQILGGHEIAKHTRETGTDYDGFGRMLKKILPDGIIVDYIYYPGAPPRRLDRNKLFEVYHNGEVETRYELYNVHGQAELISDLRTGITTSTNYDERGRIQRSEIGNTSQARVIEYEYNADDTLTRTIRSTIPAGEVLVDELLYAPPTGIDFTDPSFCNLNSELNVEECYRGLARLRLPSESKRGTLMDGTLATQRRTVYGYDAGGRTTQETAYGPNGMMEAKVEREFDISGRMIRRFKFEDSDTNPAAVSEQYYDFLNQPTKVADENHALLDSTHESNESRANRETRYDRLQRLSSVTEALGTADEATTTYDYDAHSNLAKVTDPNGRETSYLYDDFGQLLAVNSPDSGLTYYRYNSRGDLVEKVVRGKLNLTQESEWRITAYSYDSRQRIAQESVSTGQLGVTEIRSYAYDNEESPVFGASCTDGEREFKQENVGGRLSKVAHEAGATYYSYTVLGEVSAVYSAPGASLDLCAMRITRYSYDGHGRMTEMQYPSGLAVRYHYDAGTMYPSEVLVDDGNEETFMSDVDFDGLGRVTSYSSDELEFSADYDLSGQVNTRQYTHGTDVIYDYHITERDAAGNIKKWADMATGKQVNIGYDEQYRLTTATGELMRGYQDCGYSYDATGNRMVESCYGKNQSYSYVSETNSLQAVSWFADNVCGEGEVELFRQSGVNDFGELELQARKRFTQPDRVLSYSADGRLAAVTTPDGLYQYQYDNRGLRRRKILPDLSEIMYDYSEDGALLSESTPSRRQDYIWLQDILVGMYDGTDFYDIATDHLGTPQRAMGTFGEIVWAADYESFGKASEYNPGSTAEPSVTMNIRFPGQYYDAESGLHQNWWRSYDPTTGRYTRGDPLGLDGGDATLYTYALSNPFLYTDPTGENVAGAARAGAFAAALCAKIPGCKKYIKKAAKECSKIRCKPPEYHPPHHKFGFGIGPACHLQLNCWRKGVKGSKFVVRFPVPCMGPYKGQ